MVEGFEVRVFTLVSVRANMSRRRFTTMDKGYLSDIGVTELTYNEEISCEIGLNGLKIIMKNITFI